MILCSGLVLLLSLILAGGSRVAADNDDNNGIHCVTDDGNHECSKATTCSFDNQYVEKFNCPDFVETGLPNYDRAFSKDCDSCTAVRQVLTGAPQFIDIEMKPFNNLFFIVNVSWNIVHDSQHGYAVAMESMAFQNEALPPSLSGCTCIENKTTTSYTFYMEYSYDAAYSTCEELRYFKLKVGTVYPFKSNTFRKNNSYWPTNCYNFSHIDISDLRRICGPMAPRPVNKNNIRAYEVPLANTTDIAINFEWEVPADNFPGYPLMYYLILYNILIDYTGFKVFNSSSVTLWPLARNYSYNLLVSTYQPVLCSFDNCSPNKYCTKFTHYKYTPIIPVEYSSSPVVVSSFVTGTASTSRHSVVYPSIIITTPSVTTRETNHEQVKVVASVGSALILVLLALLTTLALVFVAICYVRRNAAHDLPSPSPSPTPSSIVYSSDGGRATPISPISILTFMPYDAIFIESKETPDEDRQALITYLCHEDYLGKFARVGYLDRYEQITPAEWLQRMEEVPKILCVVNKWFHKEWHDRTPGTLVAAVRTMITAMIDKSQSISSKFIVVYLDKGDEEYIPTFLNVNKFHVTDTMELAHVLTGVSEFRFPQPHSGRYGSNIS